MKKTITFCVLLTAAAFVKSQTFASLDNSKKPETNHNVANVLSSLFDNSPDKKEAVVYFMNQSECELEIKLTQEENIYTLKVPANSQNHIAVNKGNYKVTTLVCNAIYDKDKSFTDDIVITLSAPK